MSDTPELIHFPASFPLKVVGRNVAGFAASVCAVVEKHAPGLAPDDVTTRPSSGDKYLAVTVTFVAHSRTQLDTIYEELSRLENVLITL